MKIYVTSICLMIPLSEETGGSLVVDVGGINLRLVGQGIPVRNYESGTAYQSETQIHNPCRFSLRLSFLQNKFTALTVSLYVFYRTRIK